MCQNESNVIESCRDGIKSGQIDVIGGLSCCMFWCAPLGFSTVLHQFGARQAGDRLAPPRVCPASLSGSLTSRLIGTTRMTTEHWACWLTDRWIEESTHVVCPHTSCPYTVAHFICVTYTACTHTYTHFTVCYSKAHPHMGCSTADLGLSSARGHRQA